VRIVSGDSVDQSVVQKDQQYWHDQWQIQCWCSRWGVLAGTAAWQISWQWSSTGIGLYVQYVSPCCLVSINCQASC